MTWTSSRHPTSAGEGLAWACVGNQGCGCRSSSSDQASGHVCAPCAGGVNMPLPYLCFRRENRFWHRVYALSTQHACAHRSDWCKWLGQDHIRAVLGCAVLCWACRLMTLMDPKASWVSKWQHTSKHLPRPWGTHVHTYSMQQLITAAGTGPALGQPTLVCALWSLCATSGITI